MSKFTGVWAIFEYLDETTETIEQVREQGVQPTVLMPCPRHEIDHALGESWYIGSLDCTGFWSTRLFNWFQFTSLDCFRLGFTCKR